MITLNEKNVGDVVKIRENGVPVNFIIVQKGLPSNMYDSSCDGVWVAREASHSKRAFDAGNSNDYENSDIAAWLNGEYLNNIDPGIRDAIKQVKIPYKKGTGKASMGVQSGANGLSCRIFLLSGYEIGFTTNVNGNFPIDGTRLSYFLDGNSDAEAKARRICYDGEGRANSWWIRSPYLSTATDVWIVDGAGTCGSRHYAYSTLAWARPAFVLPPELLVNSEGEVTTNIPPTITSDKTGDLGTLASGFTCNYSVDDEDEADTLTVTLTLDDVQIDQFTAERNEQYSYTLGDSEWLKITEGEHTFKIIVTDGKDTVESAATFLRSIDEAFVSLESSLEADDVIRACSLFVKGSLPTDTELLCEVTNNGNDAEPVWEDCTIKVKSGVPYMFKNKTAENGFAFNFRVTAKRGNSGFSGYITEISGGFE